MLCSFVSFVAISDNVIDSCATHRMPNLEKRTQMPTLAPDLLHKKNAYWRAANYLSVGQIYLYDNPLLKEPLTLKHIKPRLLGHWGTITTPFDMVMLNDLDRFHLVGDVIDRVPQLGSQAAYVKQAMHDKLIEHKLYIRKYGEDMPEVRNWRWGEQL